MKKKGLLGLVGALALLALILYKWAITTGKIKPGSVVVEETTMFQPAQTAEPNQMQPNTM